MNRSGPIRETLVKASYEPGVLSPEHYGEMIDRELKQWGAIVQRHRRADEDLIEHVAEEEPQ